MTQAIRARGVTEIPEPPLGRLLFANTGMAWLWLIVRLYVGYQWIDAARDKLFGDGATAWVGPRAGAALKGFSLAATQKAGGAHPLVQGWYADFLTGFVIPHARAFSYAVSYGELLVGIALVIGAFTGIAAFSGAFMNMNYMLAGTTSTNPILMILALLLILAWRIAGYYGLDAVLLRALGTPWQAGPIFRRKPAQPASA